MADDEEKTEQPTPRRLKEARDGGQIAKSQDLSAAVLLLGGMLTIHMVGSGMLAKLVSMTQYCLGEPSESFVDPAVLPKIVGMVLSAAAKMVFPILVLLVILSAVIMFAQVGFLFTPKKLMPSLNGLNPINGFKRIFSARGFVQLGMNLLKLIVLAAVAYLTIKDKLPQLAQMVEMSYLGVASKTLALVYQLGMRLAFALLILALLDYAYQKYKTNKELKMTKQEVKEELKSMDGDPLIKKRRREVQMQLTIQRIQSAVPKADVVVTNPTEVAVAIRYDVSEMAAPRVVAKGQGYIAERIRQVAIQHGVPIVERRPLAQALYKMVEVGQEVPPRFYKAIAEILAYVYELKGRTGGARRPATAGV